MLGWRNNGKIFPLGNQRHQRSPNTTLNLAAQLAAIEHVSSVEAVDRKIPIALWVPQYGPLVQYWHYI